nr:MAG TPA: hypothetical protein [Caudoviricetes sp.]
MIYTYVKSPKTEFKNTKVLQRYRAFFLVIEP